MLPTGMPVVHTGYRQTGPNVFVERFNQTYRDKVLGAGVFESIDQVRAITEDCLLEIQRGAGARLPMPDDAPHLHAERVTAGNFCF